MPVTRYSRDAGGYVTEFEGAVLQLTEHNGYHDSDFFAIVYDADADRVSEVMYGTTRGGGGGTATVDATPETIEKARAAAARQAVERYKVATKFESEETAHTGRKVVFTKAFNGRKQASVKAGEVGTVTRVAEDRYRGRSWGYHGAGTGSQTYRLLVSFEDGREVWVDDDRVEVFDPETYEAPESELVAKATRWVDRFGNGTSWESLWYAGFTRFTEKGT